MYRVQTANYIRKKEILDKIEGLWSAKPNNNDLYILCETYILQEL